MFVRHLQEYLAKFTEGRNSKNGNAVSSARIYIAMPNGYLEEIRRIEVHESTKPGDLSEAHDIATDSKGNIFVAEVAGGARAQKFVFQGIR